MTGFYDRRCSIGNDLPRRVTLRPAAESRQSSQPEHESMNRSSWESWVMA